MSKPKPNTSEYIIWLKGLAEKKLLTVTEAAELYNIGQNTLRNLTSPYVIRCGNRRMVKREKFDKYIAVNDSI